MKLLLATGFRVWALADNHYDDGMMIRDAAKLINYRWLGHFDQHTLAKGITFPLYLFFINKIGLPFITSIVLLTFAASLTFVLTMRRFIQNRLLLISYSNVSCNFLLYPMYMAPAYWLIVMATFSGILITLGDVSKMLKGIIGKKSKMMQSVG